MYLPNFLDGFDRLVAFDAETTGKRSYGNVVLSCGAGNRADLRGLPWWSRGDSNYGPLALTSGIFSRTSIAILALRHPGCSTC